MRKFALVLTLTLAVGAVAPSDVHAARTRTSQPVVREAGDARDQESLGQTLYRLLLRIVGRAGSKSIENPVVPHP
ncbi:MAG TPA: hypothetical protein VGF69_16310 [Thermoanaerobaculia bacterium]|jgi:hypothetical protein